MKIKLREHPRKSLLRVDQTVKELEQMDRLMDPKYIDVVILSGLTPQYDAEVRMRRARRTGQRGNGSSVL